MHPMRVIDWIGLICFIVAIAILWRFREIVLLVFMAGVLAIALNGLVRQLMQRLAWSRGQAVLATLLGVTLVGALGLALILPPFIRQFEQLLTLIPLGITDLATAISQWLRNPPRWFPAIAPAWVPDPTQLWQQVATLSTNLFGNFVLVFSNTVTLVLQSLLVLVLTLMLLANPAAYRGLLLRLFPSTYRRRADAILSRCESALLHWMVGVSLSSLFVAALSFVGLLVLDVNVAFANAVLAGGFNVIPNIGPLLSAVFPIIVALLDSPGRAIAVILLYLVIQNLESYWFYPMIMHQQVSLLPAVTLIAQLFFATFLGPLGLILALPLAVVVKVWVEEAWIKDVLETVSPKPPSPQAPMHASSTDDP